VGGALSAVVPEPARAARRLGSGSEPDDRISALLGRSEQRSCQLVEAGQRGWHTGGVRPARVHRVHNHSAARQLLCPELGEDHLRPLGARVSGWPVEPAALALQVIDPDPLRVHATGGHVDDPCGRAFLERRDQQVSQQIRADDVGREHELDPVGRERAFLCHHACVVDQHIEAWSVISKASGELPDRLEVAEIADPHVHVAVAGPLGDPVACLLTALLTADQ
jgi:hypothetical protein